jgi:hypothetical protein
MVVDDHANIRKDAAVLELVPDMELWRRAQPGGHQQDEILHRM